MPRHKRITSIYNTMDNIQTTELANNQTVSFLCIRCRQSIDSTTRLYGGMGLGLAIVKNLVELTGGEIYLESEIGRRTTFKSWLPIK